jgi:hypothetical protein
MSYTDNDIYELCELLLCCACVNKYSKEERAYLRLQKNVKHIP